MEAGILQAEGEGEVVVHAALELSRSGWLLAVQGPSDGRPSHHKIAAGDAKRVLHLMAQARCASARRLGHDHVRVASCYEAGYEGFWLHRVLVAAGVESFVVDPSSLRVDRRAKRRKTDRIDVETILRALIAWRHGARDECSMVVVPETAAEDERRLSRERGRMVQERTAHVNRIKGLLMTVGIYDVAPLAADWRARLAALVTGDGRPLPPRLAAEIGREIERLVVLQEQIAIVERERDGRQGEQRAGTPAAGQATDPTTPRGRIAQLQKLRAVGPETASVLQSEVFYRHFDNRRQVASYVGLDPSPWSSGTTMREQGISMVRQAHHEGRQPARPARPHRARLDVAPLAARERARHLVPQAGRRRQRPRPANHDRGPRPQAPHRRLALPRIRRRPDRRRRPRVNAGRSRQRPTRLSHRRGCWRSCLFQGRQTDRITE